MRGLRQLALVVLLSACARARSLSDHPEALADLREGHPANLHEGHHSEGHHSESHHAGHHSESHHSAVHDPADRHHPHQSEERYFASHHPVDQHSEGHHPVHHHSVERHSLEHQPVNHHSVDHHSISRYLEEQSEHHSNHKHSHIDDPYPSVDHNVDVKHHSKDPKHSASHSHSSHHSIIELTSEPEYKEESHSVDLNVIPENRNAEDPNLSKKNNVQSEDPNLPVVVNVPEVLENSEDNLTSQDENSVQDHLPEIVSLIKNHSVSENQNIVSGDFNFNAKDIQLLLDDEDDQSSEEINGLVDHLDSENIYKQPYKSLSNYKIDPKFVKSLSKILRPFFHNSDENSFDLTKERIINKVTNNDNSVEILPLNPIRVNKDSKAPLALILGAPKGDKGRRKYFYSKKHKNGHVKANVEILDTGSDEKPSETASDNYVIDDGDNAIANLNDIVINFDDGDVEPDENVGNGDDKEEKGDDNKQDAVVAVLDFGPENYGSNSQVDEENNSVHEDEQDKIGELIEVDYINVAKKENQDKNYSTDKENSSELNDDEDSNDYDTVESSQSQNESNDKELERAENNIETDLGEVDEKNYSVATEIDDDNSNLENVEKSAELNDYLDDLGSKLQVKILRSGEVTKENDEEYDSKTDEVVRVEGNEEITEEVGDSKVDETSNESIVKVSSEETGKVGSNVHVSTELELKIEHDEPKKYVLKFQGDKKNNLKVGCSDDLKKFLEERQGTHKSYNLSFLFHR